MLADNSGSEQNWSSREIIQITSPVNGDEFKIDPVLRREYQTIELKASVQAGMGVRKVELWINGEKQGTSAFPFSFSWTIKPGFYTIRIKAYRGKELVTSKPVKIKIYPG